MFNDLRFRLRHLLRSTKAAAELDEELRFHLENQRQKATEGGLPLDEAARLMRLQFGGVGQVKEECQDSWGITAVNTTLQDCRYAVRILRKTPVFTTVAILLLAIGVGASTSVFTIANQVLLKMLAVEDPGALTQLEFDDTQNNVIATEMSYPAFELFSRTNPLISGTFAVSEPLQVNLLHKGVSDLANAAFESANTPAVLGLHPAVGRLFNSGDAKQSDSSPPAVLSYAYWQKHFNSSSSIIGATVYINRLPFVVAGVTAAGFRGVALGVAPDITLPVYTADAVRGVPTLHNGASWSFTVICRRRPGVTAGQIQASLAPIVPAAMETLVASVPAPMAGTMKAFASKIKFRVDSAALGASSSMRQELRLPLTILAIITGLVFLVASANLAGLLLARTDGRVSEIGLRLSLGCGRGRLMRQLLTESALLGLAGGLAGILAAYWAGPLLLTLLVRQELTDSLNVRPDLLTLAYGLALTLAAALLLGILPALRAVRLDPQRSMTNAYWQAGSGTSRWARATIVIQVAACFALAMTAGQFLRSLQNYERVDAGFRPDHLVMVSMRPDLVKYDSAMRIQYAHRVYERLASVPGVRAVTFSTSAFGKLTWNTPVNVPGHRASPTLDDMVGREIVGLRFAETIGLDLMAGRDFDQRDGTGATASVIVNQSFARRFFGSDDVVGRHVFFIDSANRADTIIGLVRDARDRGVKAKTEPVAYSSYEHDPLGWLVFTVRVRQNAEAALTQIVPVVKQVDPQVPIAETSTAAAQMTESLQRERMLATLSGILGTLTVVVAVIGLYGLLAYAVSRRTREIGIRMALGASRRSVQWLAVREGLVLPLLGVAIGFPCYWALAGVFRSQVYGVAAGDPGILGMALGLVFFCVGLAMAIPAWRAESESVGGVEI